MTEGANDDENLPRIVAKLKRAWTDECAAQIVEFAVSLPLLILFVVGIFDFSNAVSLKQKLTNAARETARVAAADSANDLGGPPRRSRRQSATPSRWPTTI